jgi:hypothetical protein
MIKFTFFFPRLSPTCYLFYKNVLYDGWEKLMEKVWHFTLCFLSFRLYFKWRRCDFIRIFCRWRDCIFTPWGREKRGKFSLQIRPDREICLSDFHGSDNPRYTTLIAEQITNCRNDFMKREFFISISKIHIIKPSNSLRFSRRVS